MKVLAPAFNCSWVDNHSVVFERPAPAEKILGGSQNWRAADCASPAGLWLGSQSTKVSPRPPLPLDCPHLDLDRTVAQAFLPQEKLKTLQTKVQELHSLKCQFYPLLLHHPLMVFELMVVLVETVPYAQFHSKVLQLPDSIGQTVSLPLDHPMNLHHMTKLALEWWLSSPVLESSKFVLPVVWKVLKLNTNQVGVDGEGSPDNGH